MVGTKIQRDAAERRADEIAQQVGAAPKVARIPCGGDELLDRPEAEQQESGPIRGRGVLVPSGCLYPFLLAATIAALQRAGDGEVVPNCVIGQAGFSGKEG